MASYEVQTDGGTYQVDTEDAPEKSVGGFGKNLETDTLNAGKALAGTAKTLVDPGNVWESAAAGSMEPTKEKLSKDWESLKSLPGALVDEGKRIGVGELVTGHPINAINKFGEAAYEKPLTTAMDVAPFFLPSSEAATAEKGAAVLPETIPKVPPLAEKLAPVAEEAPKVAPAVEGIADKIKGKIPKEVLDPLDAVNKYIGKQYSETAQKPGMANVTADYLKEHSRNMNLKEMGAAPGQVRKIGVEKAHELADYADENGLVGPKIGTIGREKLVASKLEDAGGAVGAFRKMASDRGAIANIDDLTNQVRSQLDNKYLTPGMHSGQKGMYQKALAELKKTNGSATELSDKVTEMFKEAKNQNPLGKPTGPLADVASVVRKINHQNISKALTPQEMSLYEKSLEDFGALTQIREFVKRRGSTEAGGRLGPGSGISRAAIQKFLDSFGYRAEAKIADRLSDFIRKNPDVITRPKDIFRNYIDEAAEAIHEMGDNAPH